jgi:hypothetical protein
MTAPAAIEIMLKTIPARPISSLHFVALALGQVAKEAGSETLRLPERSTDATLGAERRVCSVRPPDLLCTPQRRLDGAPRVGAARPTGCPGRPICSVGRRSGFPRRRTIASSEATAATPE